MQTNDVINQLREQVAELQAQRDNAWQELREIREAINANPEESTADEVRRVIVDLDALAAQVEVLKSAVIEAAELLWNAIGGHTKCISINEVRAVQNIASIPTSQCLAAHDAEVAAKAVENCADAKRFRWLCENVTDEVCQSGELVALKTKYKLPLIIAYADFCGPIRFADAVDLKMQEQAVQLSAKAGE